MGVAVAYKLIQALYARLGRIPDQAGIILEKYIVFAAIATIGDVVDLTGENRILAKLGLNRIAGTDNNGLLALAEANALDLNHITSYHIGFVLGHASMLAEGWKPQNSPSGFSTKKILPEQLRLQNG